MATNNSVNEPTAASGKVLQGQGVGTTSAFSTATYPSASVGSGKILYDNGTNFVTSTPTFPASASATSRKIIVSDGTNWVASTETWATPGSSGNLLVSDGTNWTSAAPSTVTGIMQVASGTLTNSQIKNLHGTPVQIVAAPGSGKVVFPVFWSGKLTYGGTNVFVAGASQQIQLYYGTAQAAGQLLSNTQIVSSTTNIQNNVSSGISNITYTTVANTALNLYVAAATEISGNAANDNTVPYVVYYVVQTI